MTTERKDIETSEWSLISHSRGRCYEYLYIVHCVGSSYYKVGISTIPPLARLANLQTGCPLNLSMIHVFANPGSAALEKEIHCRLSANRLRGEWFELTPRAVDELVAHIAARIGAVEPVIRRVA